jgi:hypothetical protein
MCRPTCGAEPYCVIPCCGGPALACFSGRTRGVALDPCWPESGRALLVADRNWTTVLEHRNGHSGSPQYTLGIGIMRRLCLMVLGSCAAITCGGRTSLEDSAHAVAIGGTSTLGGSEASGGNVLGLGDTRVVSSGGSTFTGGTHATGGSVKAGGGVTAGGSTQTGGSRASGGQVGQTQSGGAPVTGGTVGIGGAAGGTVSTNTSCPDAQPTPGSSCVGNLTCSYSYFDPTSCCSGSIPISCVDGSWELLFSGRVIYCPGVCLGPLWVSDAGEPDASDSGDDATIETSGDSELQD